jgi:hypothetical protein
VLLNQLFLVVFKVFELFIQHRSKGYQLVKPSASRRDLVKQCAGISR